jgi:hypothetical protein
VKDEREWQETYLVVLSRDLNLVNLAVLELGEVVTKNGERLELRPGVDLLLELLSPGLQPSQVLTVRRLACDEVVFVFLL